MGSVDYPATVTTCTDYPSFGRLQTGELARNNGICITNYPTNNVESDNDRPIIASGRGIETLRGQKVTLPGVPLEARAVGGGDYLANSGPMDIKILERENGVRIKSNNFDIKCGNNQTVKEEFSINVGSFSKADLEATLTYNKDKKSIAHKNKQLMPVTKSTKKMVDNAQSSSRMSAEDGEVVIEEHADYGVFAVSYKESVTQ